MSTSRRTFLLSAGAAGTLAGLGQSEACGAETDARVIGGDGLAAQRDTAWQSYVDSGFYPPRTHLLLDDFYLARQRGLKRVVTQPNHVTTEAPLLRAEKDWEGVGLVHRCQPILYDETEKLFKFWYGCEDVRIPTNPAQVRRRWAYAISSDGLNWERPNLGLVEYQGSTDNNLVVLENVDLSVAMLQNVVRDDREPNPDRRYKAIGLSRHAVRPGEITWTDPAGFDSEWYKTFGSKIGCGIFISYSPDGLRWRMREGWAASGALIADGSALHGFDPRINKWVMWQRPRIMPKYRALGMSTSDDFEHWTFPEDALAADEQDPSGMEVDSLATIAAPDTGYIGLAAMSGYDGGGFLVREKLPQLVFSRDGRQWQRVDRKPWLTATGTDAWNGGPLITPCNPILVGNEIFIYYYGKNYGNLWGEPTLNGKGIVTSALGLAKLPKDRWVALTSDGADGEFVTPLVTFLGGELHVNADVSAGSVVVELMDRDNKPIEGFRAEECDPIRGDSLDHRVSWKGQADLSRIIGTARMQPAVGRALKIRFVIEGASLYSFTC